MKYTIRCYDTDLDSERSFGMYDLPEDAILASEAAYTNGCRGIHEIVGLEEG